MRKLRIEFVFETATGITRAYVWSGMQIVGKEPYAGTLSSEEKVQKTRELIKKYTKESK